MPHRRIDIGSALGGGILAGIAYQFLQWLYVHFQIGVSSYGSIYGSFAALPLFIVWLRLSWTVILMGAEITRAISIGESYGFMPPYDVVTLPVNRLVTLRVLRTVVREAAEGRHIISAKEISSLLMVPTPLTEDILEKAAEAGLTLHTLKGGSYNAYTLAREPEYYRVSDVLETLETGESAETLLAATGNDGERISDCLAFLRQEMHRSPANLPLADL